PAQLVPAAIVTGNYFRVLGVKAALGRLLDPEDDRTPGAHPVVVLSHGFWERQFGKDPSIVGRTLTLNGHPFTVIGVATAPFEGLAFGESTAIWMPMMMVRQVLTRDPSYRWLSERRAGWLTWYGRLKPGIRLETAQAELDTIARRLEALYPQTNRGRGIQINANPSMTLQQRAQIRNLLGLLSAALGVVLLVACGNVANLLLVRATSRLREFAIRLALGADRRILLRQQFAESLLLSLAGGALGLTLAPWMLPLLRNVWSAQQLELAGSAVLDLRVLAFTLAASLLTALLFGLAPAWRAGQVDVSAALKGGSTQTGRRRGRFEQFWVIAQVTLSVALVTGGSLVLRSMQRIVAIDPGYQPERVVMAMVDLSILGYSEESGRQFFLALLERVSALPGVRSASLGKSSPALDWSDRVTVFRQGEAPAAATRYEQEPGAFLVDRNTIAPGYFRTLGIPLLAGRDFTPADRAGAPAVSILSQALAERLWPGQDPLGRRLVAPVEGRPLPTPLEVIGVAADSRYRSVLQEPPLLLYIPLLQNYDSIGRVMVAVDGDPRSFSGALRQAIQQADPELPVWTVNTMEEQMERSLWRERAVASLLSFFGVLAIALACAGIHGVLAHAVARETRSIGIRMALGADRGHVLRRVVGQALALTAAGIAAGLPLALWAKPLLAAFLYGIGAVEPVVVAGVPLLFLLVAIAASLLPAWRAARIDPAVALREE
ncbi:MAG: ABC transporter permease, partial [Acidobacteria bacterium]|nr:ABC transporter permease [Acidobacteriota bacterium]